MSMVQAFGPERLLASRRAFTLLEMVVVMATLSVLILIAAGILAGGLRIVHAASDNCRDLAAQGRLAEQFRTDVAGAIAAPTTLGKDSGGPDCLILRQSADRHVIYR